MWCEQCQQDVPATAGAKEGKFRCPRCAGELCRSSDRPALNAAAGGGRSQAVSAGPSVPSYDGWELEQQLRHIERAVGTRKENSRQYEGAYRQEVSRLDPPHPGPSAWHQPPAGKPPRGATDILPVHWRNASGTKPGQPYSAAATMIWAALSLGTMTFVCGLILLAWSLVAGRDELWAVGMPVALCGQVALLVGLVLQLDRLWHDSRNAAAKLDNVDGQIHDLKTVTTMLGTGHGSPGSAFYSHLADGAGPQLLLTDLKSQLDLLALKIMQNDD